MRKRMRALRQRNGSGGICSGGVASGASGLPPVDFRILRWQDAAEEILRGSCQAATSMQDRLLLSPESVFTVKNPWNGNTLMVLGFALINKTCSLFAT